MDRFGLGCAPSDSFYFVASNVQGFSAFFDTFFIHQIQATGRNHVLACAGTDPSILKKIASFKPLGAHLIEAPLDSKGHLTKNSLEAFVSPRTSLLSIPWADPRTGVLHPLWEIASFCREKGIFLHVDGSHVIGKLYFKLEEISLDIFTFEGREVGAPKGAGGLILRDARGMNQILHEGLSAHLEPVSRSDQRLLWLESSVRKSVEEIETFCLETARLRDLFEEGIVREVEGGVIHFKDVERLPNVSVVEIERVSSKSLLFYLWKKGLFEQFAWTEEEMEKFILDEAKLRFPFSTKFDEEMIVQIIQLIKESAQTLRKVSYVRL